MGRFVLAAILLAAALPAHGATLAERRRQLEALTAQEDALAARLGADRNVLARLLGALETFSRDPPPPLIVNPGDARDAVRAMILAKAIAPELEARAKALSAETDQLQALRRRAAQASGDLFAAESALDDRQGRLDALTADASLMAPSPARAASDSLAGLPPPAHISAPTDGKLAVRYGARLGNGLIAEGVAWRTGAGAPVRAPAAAVVAYAGPLNGWGNVVILRAGGGCHMVLSGLGKVSVAVGQSVAADFPVGAMPIDGQSPAELYLEVRLAGSPIDPAKLMGAARMSGAQVSGARGANLNAAGRRAGP